MKKTFLFYLCAALRLLYISPSAYAQTDVTNSYLQNADFETSPVIYNLE
ncbi:MAG: hypothetical protein LBM08_07550 [Dysgonamonadaceae bacterium]|jgi:hypothetical protein|nr:hypothetical protein [Dysgonamonadaceae bacterium]